ncbi:hypothetical protein GJA_5277 [Janthinobacterium agaricidamnosum NBRC 102515 = DSM 9628]|uniref:Uncharacterized protein n=1 Tax=Janthinobacterium agaricidamnosum NBRC 102515 = DSM 9628 TaxID=1349767 RepID=W0VEN6_9BURK|nr:hypothetical protein GJA_5277 [Janthinobacterium agaricidamnosum NBRC 102515 = DSM 9628]
MINRGLSTEISAFTTTTIFLYRSIVNDDKTRKTGDFSKKVKNHPQRRFAI